MKLWDKGYTIEDLIERFTVGNDRELDLKLAKYDVQGNIAHAKMLQKIDILTESELERLDDIAAQEDRSMSSVIHRIISKFLNDSSR